MSASPAVSVIVPVYNGERFLRQTLDSILAQTFHDYEIVAVDDGSSDGSRAILESYGDRVRVFTQKNLGAPSARNRAIGEARGQWIAFLDHDDTWEPDKLEFQMSAARPDDDLIHAEARVIDGSGAIIKDAFSHPDDPPETQTRLERVIRHNPIYVLTTIVRRDAIEKVGRLDPNDRFGTDEYLLWMRLLASGCKARYLDRIVASYRVHGQNASGHHTRMIYGELYALEALWAEFGRTFSPSVARAFHAKIHQLYYSYGWRLLDDGRNGEVGACFRAALRHKPLSWKSWPCAAASSVPGARWLMPSVRRLVGEGHIVSEQNGWYG
ncbi:MAG TPA: glycosyltransferase [Phycisphaerae bacterium]|nr:glycosyltransferase [Phycisphaerae bacterium]HOI53885.1 glycosyltransferase [Phycisphaerae bacterium]